MKTDKKTKAAIIAAGIAVFLLGIIFSMHAGTTVGADIGEFIYNITH